MSEHIGTPPHELIERLEIGDEEFVVAAELLPVYETGASGEPVYREEDGGRSKILSGEQRSGIYVFARVLAGNQLQVLTRFRLSFE